MKKLGRTIMCSIGLILDITIVALLITLLVTMVGCSNPTNSVVKVKEPTTLTDCARSIGEKVDKPSTLEVKANRITSAFNSKLEEKLAKVSKSSMLGTKANRITSEFNSKLEELKPSMLEVKANKMTSAFNSKLQEKLDSLN